MRRLERMTGVEPAFKAWEAFVLPMNYIRKCAFWARAISLARNGCVCGHRPTCDTNFPQYHGDSTTRPLRIVARISASRAARIMRGSILRSKLRPTGTSHRKTSALPNIRRRNAGRCVSAGQVARLHALLPHLLAHLHEPRNAV